MYFIISSRSRSSVEELKIQNNPWILIGLTWHRSLKRKCSRSQSKWINMAGKESIWEEFTNSIRVLNRGLVWIFNSSIEECDVETKNEMSSIRLINFKFSCFSYFIDLSCFDIFFQRPYRYFSIAWKVISSLSDRYQIITNDWLYVEICHNIGFSKIDVTMTTINKKLWNWYTSNFGRSRPANHVVKRISANSPGT